MELSRRVVALAPFVRVLVLIPPRWAEAEVSTTPQWRGHRTRATCPYAIAKLSDPWGRSGGGARDPTRGGESLDRTLLFRTAEGDKLLGVVMGAAVAFEVDRSDGESAWSVLVRGMARLLGEDEAHCAKDVPLRSWVRTIKYNVVEILPEVVTGRAFELTRRWTGLGGHPVHSSDSD